MTTSRTIAGFLLLSLLVVCCIGCLLESGDTTGSTESSGNASDEDSGSDATDEGTESGDAGDSETTNRIHGLVQKGPFISGATVTIQELNYALSPTGTIYSTTTDDEFGSFTLSREVTATYVEVITEGYYFDEVSGALSGSPLTLRALADISDSKAININVLTTLAENRILYLVAGGITFAKAKSQAEQEVLKIFGITGTALPDFERMDISKTGAGNAILLATSAMLQGTNSVAELSELLSHISLDIKSDGTLDKTSYLDQIRESAKAMTLSSIRSNLLSRYEDLGQTVTIPKYEDYVDTDGDGTINKGDTDTFFWARTSALAPWGKISGHRSVTFDNKIWVIGGGVENDVWSSPDGITWTMVTKSPGWTGRSAHTSVVFNNKMWVLGGYPESNDVWSSSDGPTWTQVTASADWSARRDHCSVVYNNKIWVMGGYASGTTSDVWSSSDGISWTRATNSAPFATHGQFACVVFNDKIWVGGGLGGSGSGNIYNSSDGVTWTLVASSPGGEREFYSMDVFDGNLWLVGGRTNTIGFNPAGSVWYSSDGITWTKLTTTIPWTARSSHSSVVFNNRLWILGGADQSSAFNALGDIWYYVNYTNY